MTNVEISIIVIAIFIPIVALVIFLPKIKKDKTKTPPAPPTPIVEEKIETPPAPVIEEKPKEIFKSSAFNADDFKDYLTEKSKRTDKPTMKNNNGGKFADDLFDDFPFGDTRRKRPIKKEDKPIADQIHELSPELKALFLAGVLDKKDY